MKSLAQYILESQNFLVNKHTSKVYNYHPQTSNELKRLIDKLIKERGNEANLNDIDTSAITDMSYMFYHSTFNGDISNWDVSNVEDMCMMFAYSKFTCKNGDISSWDVSNVENMKFMFNGCSLQNNLPSWYKQ